MSTKFVGTKPLQRHKLVHHALEGLLRDNLLHSLKIRTMTPQQWEKKHNSAASEVTVE